MSSGRCARRAEAITRLQECGVQCCSVIKISKYIKNTSVLQTLKLVVLEARGLWNHDNPQNDRTSSKSSIFESPDEKTKCS